MRTSISLPAPLLEYAERYAAERGVTLSALLEEALRCRLARNPSSSVPAFRLHTVRGKLVDPQMDLDCTSALIAMEEDASFRGKPR
jgi:hypothetical protein